MWCCGDEEEDNYGPPASQKTQNPAPPIRNNPGEMLCLFTVPFWLIFIFYLKKKKNLLYSSLYGAMPQLLL